MIDDGVLQGEVGWAGDGFDFVALDVETANSFRGSICALGLTVVRGGKVEATHSWLARPPAGYDHFDGFNVSLHGIDAAAVADAPSLSDRLDQLVEVVGDLPLIAHNASFDLGAIRAACNVEGRPWPVFTYGCSLVMARRSLDLLSYRLPLVAAELGVDLDRHHDAQADARAAAEIVLALARRRNAATLDELAVGLRVILGQLTPAAWDGCRSDATTASTSGQLVPPAASSSADPAHLLYGQVLVITGALSINRRDAWGRIAELGATPEKDVTKRTTFLVIGDGFRGDDPADFTTAKAMKAAKWRAKGQNIEVLTEEDLMVLLADPATAGRRDDTAGVTS